MGRQVPWLIEWDAPARLGPKADAWHIETRMRDWAPDLWTDLHRCCGRFDAEDAFAASHETADLLSKLSRRVALP